MENVTNTPVQGIDYTVNQKLNKKNTEYRL